VQRGLLRFVLSLHSPAHPFRISTDKIEARKEPDAGLASQLKEEPLLPPQKGNSNERNSEGAPFDSPSGPSVGGNGASPLPAGLNVNVLKSRLDGKKVKCVLSVTRHFAGGNLMCCVAEERS
jgi:DNA-3-methyladenine glycosylase II